MSNFKINLIKRNQGFSLVEILVGLVVGLLTTLVIMQVFSVFEGQKRGTTGNADAQTNGSIALYYLQRDIQMAGYGLALPVADKENTSLKCDPSPEFDPDNNTATDNAIGLFPIVIQDGASDASDIITVRYSNSAMGAVPAKISNLANATTTGVAVTNNIGCNNGDIVLVSDGVNCTMTKITDHNGNPDSLDHISLAVAPALGSKLSCMGDWQNYRYEIINNQLRLNGNAAVDEIVNLQAQYGISASANSNQVNEWVDATGDWKATASKPTIANRNRIKAVRLVLVARNGLMEKEEVATTCTTAKGIVNTGPCAWDDTDVDAAPKIDLSKNPDGSSNPDWKHYRYRVYETIIPLRNMLWSKGAL